MTAFWTTIATLCGVGLGGYSVGTYMSHRYWVKHINAVQAGLAEAAAEWDRQAREHSEQVSPSVTASREW